MKNLQISFFEVKSSQDYRVFLKVPFVLNSKNPNWVPPLLSTIKSMLNTQKNPYWKTHDYQLFIAQKDGKPVGRIAAIAPLHSDNVGNFGFLEAVADPDVFKGLLQIASEWLAAKGCYKVVGPFNPSLHQELGLLVKGFDKPPYAMLPYNDIYYDEMMHKAGFQKARDFYAYQVHIDHFKPSDKIRRVEKVLSKRFSISIRQGNIKEFEIEAEIIREIYNDAFSDHWGFHPMSSQEFGFMASDLKTILDPGMIHIAEVAGKPIGFLLAIPNVNQALIKIRNGRLNPWSIMKLLYHMKKIDSARVMLVAVKKQYQYLGLGSLLYLELYKHMRGTRYKHFEISWVMEGNKQMQAAAELLGGELVKTYRLYENLI